MKTIDEVIKAFECCDHGEPDSRCEDCPYSGIGLCTLEQKNDALHYLKAFLDAKNALDTEREKSIEAYRQFQDAKEKLEAQTSRTMWLDNHFQFEISDNPPLSWNELKGMKGKPVWVVVDGKERWRIIREVTNEHLMLESGLPLHRCWMNHPDGWQVYRKEKNENAGQSDKSI